MNKHELTQQLTAVIEHCINNHNVPCVTTYNQYLYKFEYVPVKLGIVITKVLRVANRQRQIGLITPDLSIIEVDTLTFSERNIAVATINILQSRLEKIWDES